MAGKLTNRSSTGCCYVEIDGAYFGTTFPHVFLMTHAQLVPPPPTQAYVPRVYGYKVHTSSEYYTGRRKVSQSSSNSSSRDGGNGNGGAADKDKYRKAAHLMDHRLKGTGRPADSPPQQAR